MQNSHTLIMTEAAAESCVKVTRACMVKPAIPPPMKTMFLSSFDLLWIRCDNVQFLFFYKLSPAVEHTSVLEGLKKSLSSILVHFYPLAGRLKKGESGRTEIDFTEAGVEFKEATISIRFEDFEKDGFRRKTFFQKLAADVGLPHADEKYNRPLLSIQVTAFEGNGICVGTTLHHVIADGNSFCQFMKSWAECSRGLPIANPPLHDRTFFKRENKSSESLSYIAHDIVSSGGGRAKIFKFVPDDSQSEYRKTSGLVNGESTEDSPQKRSDLTYSTFCFAEEMIEELKKQSRASSSFVAVAAHFWRCVVKARELPQEEVVFFAVLADCRGRVKPPVLPTYFGNCVSPGLAQTRAGTLTNSDVSFAADVIQQLINSCTLEAQIHYFMEWVESCDRHLFREAGWKYGIGAVGSPRFPMYDMDHGWGKPVDVQRANDCDIGSMVLSPPKDGGKSIMVSTCLPQHQMDFLQHLLFSGMEQHEAS